MTPRQVRSLLTVVELGSVQAAARHLHLAPSSVSAQLRELSAELGVTLFEPVGRGVLPSAATRALIEPLRQWLQLNDDIQHQAQHLAQRTGGPLRIFAPSSMCIYRLPAYIQALQTSHPGIEVLLTHEPFDYDTAFQRGELDAAVLVAQQQREDLCYQHIADEEVIFFCHPTRFRPGTWALAEVLAEPLISTEQGCTYRVTVEAHCRQQGLALVPRQAFSNVEVVRRCVLTDLGIGLLPRCVIAEDLASQQLCELDVADTPFHFFSALAYPKARTPSPNLLALWEVIAGSGG
ncbi:LysR family transcriptional regulator [Salinispirillum marinum]|uniref:LysR family transcriptional regulator n=2 Tax=Saccharospirillaceae TaxID=255527 RepID=A0ABV8BEY9_9GAMM